MPLSIIRHAALCPLDSAFCPFSSTETHPTTVIPKCFSILPCYSQTLRLSISLFICICICFTRCQSVNLVEWVLARFEYMFHSKIHTYIYMHTFICRYVLRIYLCRYADTCTYTYMETVTLPNDNGHSVDNNELTARH